jgi:hypothetical protein
MKKRLALLMLALLFALALPFHAYAEGDSYPLAEAIEGDTEQGPEWSYLVSVNGGEWQELYHTPEWGDNWQFSDTPDGVGIYYSLYYSEGKLLAESGIKDGAVYSIAARFQAPKDGELFIAPWRHPLTNYDGAIPGESGDWVIKPLEGGSAKISILHNGTALYAGDASDPANASGELSVQAKAGDFIWFVVEPLEGAEGDILLNDIAVSYDKQALPAQGEMTVSISKPYGGDGVYSLHDAYMGDSDQGPEWYYLQRCNNGDWEYLNYYPDYGDNWQVSTDPPGDAIYYSLCDWNGVSAQAGFDILEELPYDIAAAFEAPEDGTLKIAPWRHIMFANSGMSGLTVTYDPYTTQPCAAMILKNDEVLYYKRLSGGYQESPELSAEVKAGDRIYFVFRPLAMDMDVTPTLRLDDIMVGYEGVSFPPLDDLPAVSAESLPEPEAQPDDPKPGDILGATAPTEAPTQAPADPPQLLEPAQPTAEPAQPAQPTAAPTPASGSNAILILIIIIVVAGIAAAAACFLRRKK